jgi:hypothetical protein
VAAAASTAETGKRNQSRYLAKLILAGTLCIIISQAFNLEGTFSACDVLDIDFVFEAWVRKEVCGICAHALRKQQDRQCAFNVEARYKNYKYYIF